jgi:hypothetical protein
MLGTAIFLIFGGSLATAHAQDTEVIHLGVQTCAASTCHGAVQPWQNSVVLQNEFITWSTHDSHSTAYQALLSDRGKRIAARLGIGPAENAAMCLDCHTDNVAPEKRGKNFDIADGVGCESCHGGAENWLGIHVSGVSSRPDLVAAGMYPTQDPVARAELCMGCHQPNSDRLVSHRLLSAGHPRLAFELDTFTVNQPAHVRVDEDYRQRKPAHDNAKLWAIGQAVAARTQLRALAQSMSRKAGLFPELAFFECGSCHHPFDSAQWQPQPGVGLGPGEPQLYDANLVMLRAIAATLDPETASSLTNQTRALHRATRQGAAAVARAANALADTVSAFGERLESQPLDRNTLRATLETLTSRQHAADYADFGAAEQTTMAVASILESLGESADGGALDRLYETTQSPARFNSRGFVEALGQLRNSLK